MKKLFFGVLTALAMAAGGTFAGTLDDVKARGNLLCGVSTGAPGFATVDDSGKDVGFEVSEERVWEVFQQDLQVSIMECCALYETSTFEAFPGEVQEILVNMMFNMGRTRLSKFRKMNGALIEGDWKTAAIEGRDSRWHKQVTNRAERLMVRLENV